MGLFTERYEKTQTWAVLPSEPLGRDNDVDQLDAAPAAAPGDLGDGVASVTISIPAAPDASSAAGSSESGATGSD